MVPHEPYRIDIFSVKDETGKKYPISPELEKKLIDKIFDDLAEKQQDDFLDPRDDYYDRY